MRSSSPRDVAASSPDFLRREISAAAARSAADEADPRAGDRSDRDVLWAVVRRAGATPRPQLLKSGNCDRAAVVTTALLHIILSSSTPRSGLRQHVEELLRAEFADVERQAAADRTNVDA
jgi:hypothetical protein